MRKVSFARFKNVCAVGNWYNTEVLKLKIWMKNKVFPKCILIKCIGISFQSREFSRLVFRPESFKATFFKPPFWKLLHIVSFLIFTLLEFYRNSICIRCIALVISLEISKTCAKNANFDKPNFLKIISLPSSVSFLGHHILNFILMPIIVFLFWNSALVWNFYYAKKIPSIFFASLVKATYLIPQTVTFPAFSSPIPPTSHFDRFRFKPENHENKEFVFRNFFTEPKFFKKKIVSLA